MRKTIVAMLAAAAVLVIGGALGAIAQTDDATVDDSQTVDRPIREHQFEDVLDEMVSDGVITEEQATEIAAWMQNEWTERFAQREQYRTERFAQRQEYRTERFAQRQELREAHEALWEDGYLTEEEAATLPMADRLLAEDGPLAEAWEDGKLTREELEAARPAFGGGRNQGRMGGGPRF